MKYNDGWKKLLYVIPTLAVSVGIGIYIDRVSFAEVCDKNYAFINKEFWCEKQHTIEKTEYIVLKNKISSYLDDRIKTGRLSRAGIYFRDLEEGPWFGINEKMSFVPASLLKLPLLITYLRIGENTPDVVGRKISFFWKEESRKTPFFEPLRRVHEIGFSREETLSQKPFFKPSQTIRENTPYSIEELLFAMIAFSDNMAYQSLYNYLEYEYPREDLVLETYRDVGIIDPQSELEQALSPRSYASLFRILYNISYLSKPFSEKALSMLSASDFDGGLVAGVPEGIPIAHKFGERSLSQAEGGGLKELHDCGIVYYPKNPYLICIMTKGGNFSELREVIQTVSKMVYEEVDSRRL